MLMILKLIHCITAGLSTTISFHFNITGTIMRLIAIDLRFLALKPSWLQMPAFKRGIKNMTQAHIQ